MRSWRGQEAAPKAAIRHIPALDGLRGLAVAGVLLFHGGHLTGGYLGVDLFFVLSGFLITSLLLAESAGSGSVGLGGFWARRARRLLPALGGVLLAVAVYCLVFADASQLAQIRGDALATIGYTANWRAALAHQDYFALFTAPSPLEHTWSLAIEEQFYVLWPLIFVGLLAWWKRKAPMAVLVISLVLAIGSSVLMFVLYSPANLPRVYYGTDTRAGGILLGAALAAWLVVRGPVSSRAGRIAVEVAALAGVVFLAVAWTSLSGQSPRLYRGGFFLCGVAVVAVLAAATHPERGPVGRALAFRPMCLLGLISYGVYLWHWPIDVVLNADRVHLSGWWLFAVQTVATLVVAVLSYRLLEQPIRRGALSARSWRVLTPTVAIGLVLVLIASTLGAKTEPVNATADIVISNAVTNAQAAPPGTERLMVVGNSVSFFLGEALTKLQAKPRIVTLNAGLLACLFPDDISSMRVQGGPPGSTLVRGPSCTTSWRRAVNLFHPDVVLFVLSGAGQREARLGGNWVHACQPAFDQNLAQGFRHAISTLSARGAKVVLTTAAYSRSYGQTTANDRYVDCDNRVRRQVAAATDTPLIDLFKRTCRPNGDCPKFENGVKLRPDGLHYKGAGAQVIAQWIVGQLHARRVL